MGGVWCFWARLSAGLFRGGAGGVSPPPSGMRLGRFFSLLAKKAPFKQPPLMGGAHTFGFSTAKFFRDYVIVLLFVGS
jgi:hypothetical protein